MIFNQSQTQANPTGRVTRELEKELDQTGLQSPWDYIGNSDAVMPTLHRSVSVKKELSQRVKLSNSCSIDGPSLTFGLQPVGRDRKNKIVDTTDRNEFPR